MTDADDLAPTAPAPSKLDLTAYPKRHDAVSLLLVSAHVAFVLCPVFLAAATGPGWHVLGLWLWFGLTMNGLLNLLHEAAHFHVFRSRRGSDLLGHWILAPLMLADFSAYRERHWQHHRRLGTADDPKYTYRVPIRGTRFLRLALACLLLIEAVKKFFHQLPADPTARPVGAPSKVWIARGAVVQLGLLAALAGVAALRTPGDPTAIAISTATAYLFVYHYGLASLTVLLASLRGIAEHQPDDETAVLAGDAALRNFRDDPLTRLLLGAYGFSQHATHHLHPALPSYRLAQATRDLVDRGRDDLAPGPGYVPILFRLVRRGPV